jgi:hypothetical protein
VVYVAGSLAFAGRLMQTWILLLHQTQKPRYELRFLLQTVGRASAGLKGSNPKSEKRVCSTPHLIIYKGPKNSFFLLM